MSNTVYILLMLTIWILSVIQVKKRFRHFELTSICFIKAF